MALEQYAVQLTPDERERLSQLIRSGKSSARIIARARILLKPESTEARPESVSLTPWMMGKGRRTGLARSQ